MTSFTRPSFLVILCSFAFSVFSQTGNYFLTHYSPSAERFDYLSFDMAQDGKGVLYFATKAGILEFDGRDWDLLEGGTAIYSLEIAEDGTTYWAGSKGFGKVGLDRHGFQQIEWLSDSLVTNAFQVTAAGKKIYFTTEDAIFAYDPQQNLTARVEKTSPENIFYRTFELFGRPFANTEFGIYEITDDKLSKATLALSSEVIYAGRYEETYILATADNQLYSCNEALQLKPIVLKDQAYLNASVITGATWMTRQLLAIGTLRGGVVFVNPLNGITEEIVNYSTGLPDNEVFALMTDANQNVWVGHDYGFTKISPYMPLRSFSHYGGLEGNLLCAYSSQDAVYVGTSLGLYKLEKQERFEEVVYYVDVEIKSPQRQKSATAETDAPATIAEQSATDSRKKGLFGFLKRRKKEEAASAPGTGAASESAEEDSGPRYRRVKKTERVPLSASYSFQKVKGIDSKITNIVEVQDRLIASGLEGLFEVSGLSSRPVLDEPIRFIYSPKQADVLIVSTYENEVRVLRFMDKYVENSSLFSGLADQIHYVFEGTGELWFCGIESMYRAEVKAGDIRHRQTVEMTRRNIDKTVGMVIGQDVVLVNAEGFFKIDKQSSMMVQIDSLPKPSQYFAYDESIVYHDNHGWHLLGPSSKGANFYLLNAFERLRFIASDKNPSNLWLISGDNTLYKFFGEKVAPPVKDYPLFLKSIFYQDRKVVNHAEIHMDQEHSSVRFKVVQPDYVNPKATEFRYKLTGMSKDWSEWSNNLNVIDIPYMPNGNYRLEVQARNIFGKVAELEALEFEVLPPYWRRPWFYALEFSFFASLVLLSFRLSTRYRIISRLLSLLTIILLIEFIQTVVGESVLTKSSPVVDFFIQVVVALCVLPVEGYLRKLMLRSLEASGKFTSFSVPKISALATKEKITK